MWTRCPAAPSARRCPALTWPSSSSCSCRSSTSSGSSSASSMIRISSLSSATGLPCPLPSMIAGPCSSCWSSSLLLPLLLAVRCCRCRLLLLLLPLGQLPPQVPDALHLELLEHEALGHALEALPLPLTLPPPLLQRPLLEGGSRTIEHADCEDVMVVQLAEAAQEAQQVRLRCRQRLHELRQPDGHVHCQTPAAQHRQRQTVTAGSQQPPQVVDSHGGAELCPDRTKVTQL